MDLDNQSRGAEKTESILKCIDYSHSNLSRGRAGAAALPGPLHRRVRPRAGCRSTPSNCRPSPPWPHLPFDRWDEVLEEACAGGCCARTSTTATPAICACSPSSPTSCAPACNAAGRGRSRDGHRGRLLPALRRHRRRAGPDDPAPGGRRTQVPGRSSSVSNTRTCCTRCSSRCSRCSASTTSSMRWTCCCAPQPDHAARIPIAQSSWTRSRATSRPAVFHGDLDAGVHGRGGSHGRGPAHAAAL